MTDPSISALAHRRMLANQRPYSILHIDTNGAIPKKKEHSSPALSAVGRKRTNISVPPWQAKGSDAMTREELSAKIADNFQEFSAMLNQLSVPEPPRHRPPPSHTPSLAPCQQDTIPSRSSTSSSVSMSTTWSLSSLSSTSTGPDDNDPFLSTVLNRPPVAAEHGYCADSTTHAQGISRAHKELIRAACTGNLTKLAALQDDPSFAVMSNTSDPDTDMTPLMYASYFGHISVVQPLLRASVDVNMQDAKGWTALMWAAAGHQKTTIQLLLAHGASPRIQSKSECTAADWILAEYGDLLGLVGESCKRQRQRQHRRQQIKTPRHTAKVNSVKRPSTSPNSRPESTGYHPCGFDPYTQFMIEQEHDRKEEFSNHDDPLLDTTPPSLIHEDEEGLDLSECKASFQSILTFDWDRCWHDQMFVFSKTDISYILECATDVKLPVTKQDMWVPANILFLCSRYACHYSEMDLLRDFLDAAILKVTKVIKAAARDVHALCFWMANMCRLVSYIKKDLCLSGVTSQEQMRLAEIISECYMHIVVYGERQISKMLHSVIFDYEQVAIMEATEFADSWHRFFRRSRPRSSLSSLERIPDTPTPRSSASSTSQLTPRSLKQWLSSVYTQLTTFEIHPVIAKQLMAQFFHFISCETFNAILNNKRYLCRSKALQIRMNLSALEEWARENKLPMHPANPLQPVIQLLQLLQCLSGLSDLAVFKHSLQGFDRLNPVQVKRCVVGYRYETSEARLPEEIEQYVIQLVDETQDRRQSTDSTRSAASIRRQSMKSSARRTSVPTLSNLVMSNAVTSPRNSMQRDSFDMLSYHSLEENQEDDPELELAERRNSRYLLPFSLATSTPSSNHTHLTTSNLSDMPYPCNGWNGLIAKRPRNPH
ncbi:DIL domain-containing protein [Radiomyces spectabilis]|uniref:DIL domain-containing protein n=1 Tax=Radiomyces spectabilis TaxID=64574 RepID=UPI00221E9B1E|nr:DIL domain-containing protein [Radiomyces spectabilis]KAI8379228.1 DIL domain-containing protein [Radiomyces spectabilis]